MTRVALRAVGVVRRKEANHAKVAIARLISVILQGMRNNGPDFRFSA